MDELAELFEDWTRLAERLAETHDPLGPPEAVIAGLTESEKIEAIDAHPAIGARRLSDRSAREQGEEAEPEVAAELGRLNRHYEEKFDFGSSSSWTAGLARIWSLSSASDSPGRARRS